MPVNQLGTTCRAGADDDRHFTLGPSAVPLIDKAIRTSDLGLNPTNDGKIVRVPIPSLTESVERTWSSTCTKSLKIIAPPCANIRRDIQEAVEKLEKEKKISEDERKRAVEELEKLTHSETKKNRRSLRHEGEGNPRSEVTTLRDNLFAQFRANT